MLGNSLILENLKRGWGKRITMCLSVCFESLETSSIFTKNVISPLQLLKTPVTKTLWRNTSSLDPFKSNRYQSSYFHGDCSSYFLVQLHESLAMIITSEKVIEKFYFGSKLAPFLLIETQIWGIHYLSIGS